MSFVVEYGSAPWRGPSPYTDFEDAIVDTVAENCIRITFENEVYFSGVGDPEDAYGTEHYTVSITDEEIAGIDQKAAREVSVVGVDSEPEDGRVVYLMLDRAMSHYPVQYTLTTTCLSDISRESLPELNETVYGVQLNYEKPVVDTYKSSKDLHNPSTGNDEDELGTFVAGNDGDYEIDDGVLNLKKRILRRIIVKPGGFIWLPEYGAGIKFYGKRLGSLANRERLRAAILQQIKEEPDVQIAKVFMNFDPVQAGLLWLYIRVKTSVSKIYQFDVPIEIQE